MSDIVVDRVFISSQFIRGVKKLNKDHRTQTLSKLNDALKSLEEMTVTSNFRNHPVGGKGKVNDLHIDDDVVLLYRYRGGVLVIGLELNNLVNHRDMRTKINDAHKSTIKKVINTDGKFIGTDDMGECFNSTNGRKFIREARSVDGKPQWFTVMFFHKGDTYTGIIYAADEESAREKFAKYCPHCKIDRVKKGILGHDYPMITRDFELNMGWDELVYDDAVTDSFKDIFDVMTPQEVADATSHKVSHGDKVYEPKGWGRRNESIKEDTVKQNGKWVNKGKEGTHGKFRTKKAADAQRKAMFANGYHEGIKESVRPEDAWCGCADAIDGEIYELHTYEEAEASDFHHSLYFSPNALDKMDEGECVFFCKDDNGGIFLDPFDHMPAGVDKSRIINHIKKQLSGSIVEKVAPPDYSPSKTGKAYKVFKVKNGKLYPPMVANPGGEDTPVGVWLDAEEGEFAGLSKTGRPQVKSTQSSTLSYRPGWHLGDVPRAPQFDRRNKETGKMEFPKDFVWAECDYAMDVDYQPESDEQGYMRTKVDDKGNITTYRSNKYQHSLAGLPKLPKDGYYKYRTNPRPDTVPWVITGQMRVNKLLSDDEVNAILKSKGIEPIHRQGGDKTLAELGLE